MRSPNESGVNTTLPEQKIDLGLFSFTIHSHKVQWAGRDYDWTVELQVLVNPRGHAIYQHVPDGRVVISFRVNVSNVADEAEAFYKASMAAFEHELLEWTTVNGQQWKDPHEQTTPLGATILSV